jgi:uncharacterized protein
MKILITGGTGFVGTALSKRLLEEEHEVTVIGSSGRSRLQGHPHLTCLAADTTRPGDWQQRVAEHEAVVNLAGRSVFNLWTEKYKQAIYDSRILTTRNLVAALPESSQAVLLSASAAGYYGNSGETEVTEQSPNGDDFLAHVCRDWEKEAANAAHKGARVALMRFGVILGSGGGALATMKTPFKFGLGGPLGSGKQWFPWIHLDDLISAILFLLSAETCSGPFNFTAPQTVRQKEFARQLAAVLHRPAILPAPSFAISWIMGEFGRSLLQGQKIIPQALIESGFQFTYPELPPALTEIFSA